MGSGPDRVRGRRGACRRRPGPPWPTAAPPSPPAPPSIPPAAPPLAAQPSPAQPGPARQAPPARPAVTARTTLAPVLSALRSARRPARRPLTGRKARRPCASSGTNVCFVSSPSRGADTQGSGETRTPQAGTRQIYAGVEEADPCLFDPYIRLYTQGFANPSGRYPTEARRSPRGTGSGNGSAAPPCLWSFSTLRVSRRRSAASQAATTRKPPPTHDTRHPRLSPNETRHPCLSPPRRPAPVKCAGRDAPPRAHAPPQPRGCTRGLGHREAWRWPVLPSLYFDRSQRPSRGLAALCTLAIYGGPINKA